MDPLSFTASLTAVVGLGLSTAQKLRATVSSLRHAPADLHALSTELSDLNNLFLELEAFSRAAGSRLQTAHSGLTTMLRRAKSLLGELENYIGELSGSSVTTKSRMLWASRKKKAKALLQDFQVIRINLLALTSARILCDHYLN
jgi:hypothetical protein